MGLFWIFCVLLAVLPLLHFLKVLAAFFRDKGPVPAGGLPCTVIVPFRNEELRLERLLHSLEAFRGTEAEILFVNDHSTDASCERIHLFSRENPDLDLQLLGLPAEQKGKKAAMKLGAAQARNEVLYFCDADTQLSLSFARRAVSFIGQGGGHLLQGIPRYRPYRFFIGDWAAVEFMALVYIGVYFWRLRVPFLNNAAVMATDRSTFLEADLNVFRFPGGDDVFLLQHVNRTYGIGAIKFVPEIVDTEGPAGWAEYISQRVRWASKTTALKRSALLPLGVYLLLSQYLWLCFLPDLWTWSLALLGAKVLTESVLLCFLARRSGMRGLYLFMPLYSLLLPLFFPVSALFSVLSVYRWKGRVYDP